jgi:beta-1,4-mannosyl-glycoprotein beta-1,4-N-acetylglucosaminyltransferase
MKIVDCFTFYNELDMLEYRLELLYPIVDYFVLSEATLTHKGNPKPLFYQENKKRYEKYADKIIHLIDKDLIPYATHNYNLKYEDEVWKNENHQRNYIKEGLRYLNLNEETDYILISDLDEILNPNTLSKLFKENKSQLQDYMSFYQDFYYYNLTCKNQDPWLSPKLVKYGTYKNYFKEDANKCRLNQSRYIIPNGGWHLSYFGGASQIKNKIQNFSHQEFNKQEYTDEKKIEEKINAGIDLFGRTNEKWITIPIENNTNLPPKYEIYLKNAIPK